MRKLSHYIVATITIVLITSLSVSCDKDDDYIYPSLRTDFMDLHTNDAGIIDRIQVDGEPNILYPHTPLSGNGLKQDTVYRAVGRYSLPNEDGYITMYSVQLIQANRPTPPSEIMLANDPLTIESVYRARHYLNVIAQPLGNNHIHFFDFTEEGIDTKNGYTIVTVLLRHSRNGDRESFPRRTYFSIPLSDYNLQKGDSIYFQANVYNQGIQTWKIAY